MGTTPVRGLYLLVFHSTDYSQGPVPGLACGTLLAPVLSKLDEIDGILEARVDPTGRHFVIRFEGSPPDVERITARVLAVLGRRAVRLDPPLNEPTLQNFGRGELWLCEGTARALSLIEARILSVQHASRAAREAALDPRDALELQEILHDELAATFGFIHDLGGTSDGRWWSRGFADAFERAASRMRKLTVEQRQGVRSALLASLPDENHETTVRRR